MEYVGRIDEIKEIKRLELSSRSEFLVIYGRRRIGKTQLVRSLYLPKLAAIFDLFIILVYSMF